MSSALSVAIIDSDRNSRTTIEEILRPVRNLKLLTSAGSFQDGFRIIHSSPPEIIILEVKELERGVEEVNHFLRKSPKSSVFVTAVEKNPDWILRLIRAGACEYLTKPLVGEDLLEAVRKVSRLQARELGKTNKKGALVTVYNPSGGMGTTTIAVNLAATLAGHGKKTALIDLNLFSCDVTAFLDLTPRYTLASIAAKAGQLDASILNSVVVPHACGVHVLSGPRELSEAGKVTPELLGEVLGLLEEDYDYTIVDSGGHLSQANLTCFSGSDMLLFNTVLSLPALKNAKRYLPVLDAAGVEEGKLKLLVNRHNTRDEIRVADAEKVLGKRCYIAIPNAYHDVKTSINKGTPFVDCFPKSPVTKAMVDLSRQVLSDASASSKFANQEIS